MATSVTGPDVFQSTFTDVGGIAQADEAQLQFTKDGTTYYLAAENVKLTYQDNINIKRYPNGKVLVISNGTSGGVSISTLVGYGLTDFLDYYGNICNIAGDVPLEFYMDQGLTCSDVDLDVSNSLTWRLYNNHLTKLGVQAALPNAAAQLQLIVLNLDLYKVDGQEV